MKRIRRSKAENQNTIPGSVVIESWDETVDAKDLLNEISETIRKFIVCNDETVVAATLWTAFTWLIDHVQVAPLAIITAPEKRCGKSQLLTLMGEMSRNALIASNISASAIYRVIEEHYPTLLIDEADTFLRDTESMRGIINSGHTRKNAYVVRVDGDDLKTKQFSTWSAKVICGIGSMPETLIDRAIILELRRKLSHEKIERLRHADPEHFRNLQRKLSRFALDAGAAIEAARPSLPDSLNDRAQDNWEPLLAIADYAGGEWPEMARKTALTLSEANQDSLSLSAELLADIQEIFAGKRIMADRISTADLLNELNGDDLKPWQTYDRGKPMRPRQLAKRLAEYGIKPTVIRIGNSTPRGFYRTSFEDAFMRYLPSAPPPPEKSATAQQTSENPLYTGFSDGIDDLPCCATEASNATGNPQNDNECFTVADDGNTKEVKEGIQ
ncbi:MAG: DUF3631 domain-containing protein [Proteobacteria bacterium]|nr:DUF3631 domain-containing protein [Pseudomonadota bacterium]